MSDDPRRTDRDDERRSAGHAVVVAGIVAMGLVARIAGFVGPTFSWRSDESRFIELVQNMSNGYFPDGPAEWFGTRLVMLAPPAGIFRVFGSGDLQVAVWPTIWSLASIVVAYLLGGEIASHRVGVVAALVVALTPMEARLGTVLRPDAIAPAMVGFAVWFALRSARTDASRWWAFGAGLALGAGWSVRENALVLAPIVLYAGWRGVRHAILPALGGLAIVPAVAAVVFAVGAGTPAMPLVGAGTEGVVRNPFEAWRTADSYLAMLWHGAFDRRSLVFLAGPVMLAAIAAVALRRDRRAILPCLWLAWAGFYLEFGTLVNLAKPNRYLTLCTIPAAILVALAVDGRLTAWIAPAVAAAATVGVLWSVPARDLRADDVALVSRVVDRLSSLPEGPVITESYTWYAKFQTYLARRRIPIARTEDPEFVSNERARELRMMDPLPDPAAARGGYVVTGPVHPRAGWPRNWDTYRARLRAVVPPTSRLTLVADLGRARIWRWEAP